MKKEVRYVDYEHEFNNKLPRQCPHTNTETRSYKDPFHGLITERWCKRCGRILNG